MNWLSDIKLSVKIYAAIIISVILGAIIGYGLGNMVHNTVSAFTALAAIALVIMMLAFFRTTVDKPFLQLSSEFEKLLKGDPNVNITNTGNDEIGSLEKLLLSLSQTVKSFNMEADSLGKAIENGDLTLRMNTASFNGCWAQMAAGFNKSIDTVLVPMNEAIDILNRYAVNDYTIKMEDRYKGSFHQFAEGINTVHARLLSIQDAFSRVAKGDLSRLEEFRKIGKRSDNDMIMPAMIAMSESIANLINEVNTISKAVNEGKLDVRGNIDRFEGGYKTIIAGMNDILGEMERSLNSALEVLGKTTVYDFSMQMDNNYKGVFGSFAKTINEVQKHLLRIEEIVTKISCGDLSDLEALKKIGRRSEKDNLVPAFINMMETIRGIINEIEMFTQSAIEGKLSTRGEAGKFKGVYMEIIQGLNSTLDAVVEPINEASSVLKEMARGNLRVSVKGNYKGDHAEIKNALNETIDTLKRYIGEISQTLVEMAGGNFDIGIKEDYKGDFEKIKESLNHIIDSLNEMLGNIDSAAEQVAVGSRQVSTSSQILSQGSTEQASSIEEITASMTQIASQTKLNANNANQANELSLSAKEIAVQGNGRMQEMVKAMAEINESSNNISRIIKVIDDIAFQTNILALNAAVEAARAGQHGKGFAVVAEEVRNLAERSANAAKETTDMIEGSIRKVEIGTRIANDTAEALNEIVEGVAKAAVIVGNIASASNEQATSISQINQAISQVAQVVQTNSATSQESAAASEELFSQADMLKNSISKFKLKSSRKNVHLENGLSPDMMHMLENYMDKRKSKHGLEKQNSVKETSEDDGKPPKVKLSLEENEFGKY